MDIGARIRKLRLQQSRTIQEVADVCHFSKGLLSKIETGKVVPPIATLTKIAGALGVKISTLMEENGGPEAAVTPDVTSQTEAFVMTSYGYAMYALAPHFLNKKMQPMLIHSQKNEVKPHSVSHEGEEFIYVLEGCVEIQVGKVEYQLKQGESMYFDSTNVHGVLPVTESALYLDILVA